MQHKAPVRLGSSNPDADNLERMLSRATSPVRLHLLLTPRTLGPQPSGNVIAEVPGSDPAAGLIVIGGHLDSWDLGTGAIDDGSGLAITTAAASAFLHGKKPRRTIRLIWWGAEEMEPFGARAYFSAHRHEPHALVAEADFGADRVWLLRTRLAPTAQPVGDRLAAALAPLGVGTDGANTIDGEDIAQFIENAVSGVYLARDLGRYFDFHHTPDDTLDKIDPAQLPQCAEAWTRMLDIVANAPERLLAQTR